MRNANVNAIATCASLIGCLLPAVGHDMGVWHECSVYIPFGEYSKFKYNRKTHNTHLQRLPSGID